MGGEQANPFRFANELLEERFRAHGAHGPLPLICECRDGACLETVRLDAARFADVRAQPGRFVMRPGHHDADRERIVDEGDDFVVAERLSS